MHLTGWLSPSCLVLFLEFWAVLSFGPYFFVSCTCYVVRGWALGLCQGGATHISVLCYCMLGRIREGIMPLAWPLPCFWSLPPLPTSELGTSGADYQVGGLVYILGPCGSLQWTLLWGWEFLSPLQPPQVFTARGFEVLFPWTGTLGFTLCLTTQLFLLVYLHANVRPPAPVLQLPPYRESSPPQLPTSGPPTCLDECFFFNSSVVRLPYSLTFRQFRLFFVFKFVVVLLLVVRGGILYLPTPPCWPKVLKYYSLERRWSWGFAPDFKVLCWDEVSNKGIY